MLGDCAGLTKIVFYMAGAECPASPTLTLPRCLPEPWVGKQKTHKNILCHRFLRQTVCYQDSRSSLRLARGQEGSKQVTLGSGHSVFVCVLVRVLFLHDRNESDG